MQFNYIKNFGKFQFSYQTRSCYRAGRGDGRGMRFRGPSHCYWGYSSCVISGDGLPPGSFQIARKHTQGTNLSDRRASIPQAGQTRGDPGSAIADLPPKLHPDGRCQGPGAVVWTGIDVASALHPTGREPGLCSPGGEPIPAGGLEVGNAVGLGHAPDVRLDVRRGLLPVARSPCRPCPLAVVSVSLSPPIGRGTRGHGR